MTPFWCGVLHGLADVDEQPQPLLGGQLVLVTVLGDRQAFDEFHDEVGTPAVGQSAVQDMGDIRMIHQGQGLPFRLKPCHHRVTIHPRLDHLQSHFPDDRRLLLGHEHHAEAAFADLLEQLVAADDRSRALGHRLVYGGSRRVGGFEEVAFLLVDFEQSLHALAEVGVAGADLVRYSRELRRPESSGPCGRCALHQAVGLAWRHLQWGAIFSPLDIESVAVYSFTGCHSADPTWPVILVCQESSAHPIDVKMEKTIFQTGIEVALRIHNSSF